MDDETYDLGVDEPDAKPRRPGLPVEPRRLLRILAPERKRLLRAFLIAAAVSLFASLFVPETYESAAVLVYEGAPLPVPKEAARAAGAFVRAASAQSRLREVRDRLGWGISDQQLMRLVQVTEEKGGSMRIAAQAGSAEDAQLLAQTVLDVFLAHQAAFHGKRLEVLTAENELSLERANERRDAAQEAFDAFRKKSGKSDLLNEKAQLLTRAAGLRSRADEAEVEIAAQTALIEELETAQRELPRQIVGSATKGSAVEGPLARARSELAEARATLSEAHPRVQALKQRVAGLEAQKGGHPVEVGEQTLVVNPARASVEQQLAGARASLAAARERYAALQVLLQNVQREADALAPAEGEARRVMGELSASIARVEQLRERKAALRDAALGPLTGFRVLSSPVVPEESVRAMSYVVFLFLFPFLAVLLYALLILLRSLRTLKVEAPREVAWWGNGPVLGTSVWPSVPDALDDFVDELEDQGVYGAGRTLVVPATEAEREIACSFAMRLAEAPWLAAAILDVGERAGPQSALVTPAPGGDASLVTPAPESRPRRLSTQGTPSVAQGRAIPHKPTMQGFVPPTEGSSSAPPGPEIPSTPTGGRGPLSADRPPRKRTVIGLPSAESPEASEILAEPTRESTPPPAGPAAFGDAPSGLQPFRRKREARATIRMVVPVTQDVTAAEASTPHDLDPDEEAFLLTRPVPIATDETPSRASRAIHESAGTAHADASNAVMRAAVRLLGSQDEDITQLRRSEPPARARTGDVTGVALAWNGPLTGPVLRRAARLAHRVMVVVSSGLSVVDLARVQTRLGRDKGVGYVLVNVDDSYVDAEDRVGPVEEFWRGEREADSGDPQLP